MSRQVSFFTDPEDRQALHAWLLAEFPGVQAIGALRGSGEALAPRPVEPLLEGDETIFLVPVWAQGRIVLEQLEDGSWFLVQRASPVIEYWPSQLDLGTNHVTVGRLYWSFEGEVTPEEARQIDRMFRWVRNHSLPLPSDRRFRVFEHAARNRRILDFRHGTPEPSPPWKE